MRLDSAVLVAAILLLGSACASARAPTASTRGASVRAAPPPTSAELTAARRAIVQRANAVRAEMKLAALHEVPELTAAAQDYASELAKRQRLDHNSPLPGRQTMTQRIEAAGGRWQRAAENLASTSDSMVDVPQVVIELWLTSAGHRRNLLDPSYTTTGVGIARDTRGLWYVVQLYVLPPARR
jgi:uncharacterized protein YkwD